MFLSSDFGVAVAIQAVSEQSVGTVVLLQFRFLSIAKLPIMANVAMPNYHGT